MAILESNTRRHQMRERSARGPPSFCWMVSLAPHTCWMIDVVRASEPRRRREQRASAWARALLIVRDFVVNCWVEVGNGRKVGKEHVDKGMVALLVSFASCAHASVIKSKDEVGKYTMVLIRHTAVVTRLVIKFSATLRITSVSNGGSSHAGCISMGEEHTTIMEVEVCIQNWHALEPHDGSSKGVCHGTPSVSW
jgi:hypothetical protein